VQVRDAAVVTTTAAAVAAGSACGLFWAAFHDPVAIGWLLTPFIGAFWGCLVGLLEGGLLRLALRAGLRDRSVPAWGWAVGVSAVAAVTALALAGLYTAESLITDSEAAQAMGLAVLVTATVALALQAVRHRRAARGRDSLAG